MSYVTPRVYILDYGTGDGTLHAFAQATFFLLAHLTMTYALFIIAVVFLGFVSAILG